MLCWLAEQLIMPEANRAPQQLTGGSRKGCIPENVMEPDSDSPRAKRMKQHTPRVPGFIGIVFVPEIGPRMTGLSQAGQFAAKNFNLVVIEDS